MAQILLVDAGKFNFHHFLLLNFFPADVSGLDRNERFRKHAPVEPLSFLIRRPVGGMTLNCLEREFFRIRNVSE